MENNDVREAAGWSIITETLAKIIVPITNIVLARLLAPEVFGIITTINMIISFAEMFTSAGVNKYLIQERFSDDVKQTEFFNTAYTFNTLFAFLIWTIIIVLRNPLATIVGSEGYGTAVALATIVIPITAFSSIQEAKLQKQLEFKRLFYNRIGVSVTPLLITVPLALLGCGYWSLIVGNIASSLVKALIFSFTCEWKPRFLFSIDKLRRMITFTFWNFCDAFALWGTDWIDIFIIGNALGLRYTGLYRNAQNLVTSLFSIITASMRPVMYASLSKHNNNDAEYKTLFSSFQRNLAFILLPMGVGIYIFRSFLTNLFLGSQWIEASDFIGYWAISIALVSVFSTTSREALRSLGKPKVSFFAQIIQLVIVASSSYLAASRGFTAITIVRPIASLFIIIIHFFFIKKYLKIRITNTIRETLAYFIGSCVMISLSFVIDVNSNVILALTQIALYVIVYFAFLVMIPRERERLLEMAKEIKKKVSMIVSNRNQKGENK